MHRCLASVLMISLGELQKEQQNDKNQLVSELKNVDADTQRLRRDTDSQMHRKGLDQFHFRWLKIKVNHTACLISITLFFNDLN